MRRILLIVVVTLFLILLSVIPSIGSLSLRSSSSIVSTPSLISHTVNDIKHFEAELDSQLGHWSPSTSTIDWCEKNYAISYYIAEFWNTFSSLSMSALALFALYRSYNYTLEKRFIIFYIGFFLVGIGSAAFHSTILYTGQLFDELGMIWVTSIWYFILFRMNHIVINKRTNFQHRQQFLINSPTSEEVKSAPSDVHISINSTNGTKDIPFVSTSSDDECIDSELLRLIEPSRFGDSLAWFLLSYATFWTFLHAVKGFVLTFQAHFIVMIFFGIYRLYRIMRQSHHRVPIFNTMFTYHIFFLFMASICWLCDQWFCTSFNHSLSPFNPQLHALWHCFIALDVYYGAVAAQAMRILTWKYFYFHSIKNQQYNNSNNKSNYYNNHNTEQQTYYSIDINEISLIANSQSSHEFNPSDHIKIYFLFGLPMIRYQSHPAKAA